VSKLNDRRKEIREYTTDQAEQELQRLRRQLFDLRIQQQRGEVKNNRQFSQVRTDIARLMYQVDLLALAEEEELLEEAEEVLEELEEEAEAADEEGDGGDEEDEDEGDGSDEKDEETGENEEDDGESDDDDGDESDDETASDDEEPGEKAQAKKGKA
jgi:ribosomal protein L29